MRIGIFDSGIGGLNVLKEIMKKYPNQEYIYFGDTLYLPYGEKTKEELIRLGTRIIRFFEQENVDRIVIACGTCSCLIDEYQSITKIPIDDVITPTVKYVQANYNTVVLLATPATIQSHVFEQKLCQNGMTVIPLACTNFVPYIEGLNDQLDIKQELKPIEGTKYEAVILGCTHYPLLKKEIKKICNVPLIDMGEIMRESLSLIESTYSLRIYMSRLSPFLKQNVKKILKRDVEVIEKNLPV